MPAIRNSVIDYQLLDRILGARIIIYDYFPDIDIATAGFDALPRPFAVGIMTGLTAGPLCPHMVGGGAGQYFAVCQDSYCILFAQFACGFGNRARSLICRITRSITDAQQDIAVEAIP